MRRILNYQCLILASGWLAFIVCAERAIADCTDPQLEWEVQVEGFRSRAEAIPYDVAIGPGGEVFVVGQFRRLIDFDPSEETSDFRDSFTPVVLWPWNEMDLFVTRLEADGSYGWTYVDGFSWGDAVLAVAIDPPDEVDPEGYIVVAGYYEEFLFAGLGPSDGRDAFVAKFPIDGAPTPQWARSFGNDGVGGGAGQLAAMDGDPLGGDAALAVAVNPLDGSVIVGLNDGEVIKLDAEGEDDWSRSYSDAAVIGVAIDTHGDVLVAQADGSISKLAGGDGSGIWSRALPGVDLKDITINSEDNAIFLTGGFRGTVDFDPGVGEDNLTSVRLATQPEHTEDIFVTRLNTDGAYAWTWVVGGSRNEHGRMIATDVAGDGILVTGRFEGGVANFNPYGAPDLLAGAGVFVTRLRTDGQYVWTHHLPVDGAIGHSTVASAVASAVGGDVLVSSEFALATHLRCDFPADDLDGDGVPDVIDNCPTTFNASPQLDSDGDGRGDACDVCPDFDDAFDVDSDGFPDSCDNCSTVPNPLQSNVDDDEMGDVCDPCLISPINDPDEDGLCANVDNCPFTSNADQIDTDDDGIGNACEDDDDADGVSDEVDNCQTDFNPLQDDHDTDGIGDECDNCLVISNSQQDDYDKDGLGDACDSCPGNRGVVVYWSDSGGRWIKSKETSPTLGCEELRLSGLVTPVGIFADPAESKLYWIDASLDVIRRSDLVGLNVEDVVTAGLDRPQSLVVFDSKVYWTDWGFDRVVRANLDGSDIEVIRDGASNPYGLAIDVVRRKLYWSETDFQTGAIRRCELNGADPELVFGNLPAVTGIAIDDAGERLFWVNWGDSRLQTASLDGGVPETLYLIGDFTESLSLFRDSLYWTDSQGDVFRADADGFGVVERVVEGAQDPRSVAVVAFGGAPGDCNGSGSVTLDDVPCFVTALLGDGSGFTAADVDENGIVDGRDLQPFVSLLLP